MKMWIRIKKMWIRTMKSFQIRTQSKHVQCVQEVLMMMSSMLTVDDIINVCDVTLNSLYVCDVAGFIMSSIEVADDVINACRWWRHQWRADHVEFSSYLWCKRFSMTSPMYVGDDVINVCRWWRRQCRSDHVEFSSCPWCSTWEALAVGRGTSGLLLQIPCE